MQTTSMFQRSLSAALAIAVSAGLLVVVGEQMNPVRLAATPHVVEFESVTITAPAPARGSIASAEAGTAAN